LLGGCLIVDACQTLKPGSLSLGFVRVRLETRLFRQLALLDGELVASVGAPAREGFRGLPILRWIRGG